MIFVSKTLPTSSDNPLKADPLKADPLKADSFKADSFKADPLTADSFKADPLTADSFKADPLTADSFKADPLTGGSELSPPLQDASSHKHLKKLWLAPVSLPKAKEASLKEVSFKGVSSKLTAKTGEEKPTADSRGEKLRQSHIATAIDLINTPVLVPGSTAIPDKHGMVQGMLDIPIPCAHVEIIIARPDGVPVASLTLGTQEEGLVNFAWDGRLPEAVAPSPSYEVSAFFRGRSPKARKTPARTSVYTRVKGVTFTNKGRKAVVDFDEGKSLSIKKLGPHASS